MGEVTTKGIILEGGAGSRLLPMNAVDVSYAETFMPIRILS
jgi:hypothetical protein